MAPAPRDSREFSGLSSGSGRAGHRLGRSVRLQDLAVDPYPILARLRAEEPVSWVDEAQMWFVTRRADVITVLRDPDTFSTDSPRSTIRDTFGSQMLSAEGEQHRRYKSQCSAPFNTRAVNGDGRDGRCAPVESGG